MPSYKKVDPRKDEQEVDMLDACSSTKHPDQMRFIKDLPKDSKLPHKEQ